MPNEFVNARDPASASTIFQGAVEGHVLVKNVDGALPLKQPKFLSLYGYDAYAPLIDGATGTSSMFAYGWQAVGQISEEEMDLIFDVSPSVIPGIFPQAALNGTRELIRC